MFGFYICGVMLSCIFVIINYMGYLQDNNIKHPHWLYYVNEIFWQLLMVGILSWIGLLICIISIGNRFGNKL